MEELIELVPFLIPIIIIQLTLMITALVHVVRHPNYRFGNKVVWVLIVVIVQIIGPIIYFVLGRGDE